MVFPPKNLYAKTLQVIVLGCVFMVIHTRYNFLAAFKPHKDYYPEKRLLMPAKEIFPGIRTLEKDPSFKRAFRAFGSNDNFLGWMVETDNQKEDIKSYGGSLNMLIGLNKDLKIKGITVLSHRESPSFFKKLYEDSFFDSWDGLGINQALDKEVDSVSGATVSSSAVKESVRKTLSRISRGESILKGTAERPKRVDYKTVLVALFLVFSLLSFFEIIFFTKKRFFLLLYSVIILGFFSGSFLSLVSIINWVKNGLVYISLVFIIAAVSSVLSFLFGKNFYCGYICPYGALQEICGCLSSKKKKLSKSILKVLRITRRFYIFFIFLAILILGDIDLVYTEPFAVFLPQYAPLAVIILASIFLAASFFIPRFWCSFFCPTGQIMELFCKSAFRLKRAPADKERTLTEPIK